MELIDFVLGFVNGVLLATLFWGTRHFRFERRLNKLIAEHFTEEEQSYITEKER